MALNLNKLKSLFVVTEEGDQPEIQQPDNKKKPKQNTPTPPTDKPVTSRPQSKQTTPPPAGRKTKGVFNQKVYDSLIQAIERSNLEGEDYLEFVSALNAMESLPMTEEVKIQSVLATLSTRGLTLPRIYESADYYLKILENEKSKFNEALKGQTTGKIGGKRKEITELEKSNKEKSEQIQLLTKQIQKNQEEILRLKNEINDAENKINQTVSSFNTTYDAVSKQIKENVHRIKRVAEKE